MASTPGEEGLRNRSQTPTQQRGGAYFPLGYKEAFSQWWAGLTPAQTEHTVLSFIPFIQRPTTESQSEPTSKCSSRTNVSKLDSDHSDDIAKADLTKATSITDPFGARKWFTETVKLSGKDRALHEFSVERVGEAVENDLVMLHGYGAGLGFFYQNYEPLSRLPGWRIFSLDLLGMGRSSRPPFRIYAKDKEGKIQEAENWFIDALEEWREKKKIEKFTLLGHSMGGYMAVAYALKYPGRLKKLILVSPVGIPEDPFAVNSDLPEPQSSTLQNEFTQSQEELTNPSKTQEVRVPRRQLPKWATYLWDANVSPFSLVRLSGPLGPSLVSGWTTRRFAHLPENESQALHNYSYSLFRQRGSGEYALAYILAPGAFARSPLIRRIQGVGRQHLTPHASPTADSDAVQIESNRENGIPVVLMYGEHDWMDVKGGYAAEKKINATREKLLKGKTAAERRSDQGSAKVVIVPKSGHHIYLDNPNGFNDEMLLELRDVQKKEAARNKQ